MIIRFLVGISILLVLNCRDGGEFKAKPPENTIEDSVAENLKIDFLLSKLTVDESSSPIDIDMRLNIVTPSDLEVSYSISGTANEEDFDLKSGSFSINKNESTASLTINLAEDNTAEAMETIEIKLLSSESFEVGNGSIKINIIDNDTDSVEGEFAKDGIGEVVASLGDINSDQVIDYMVAAPNYDSPGSEDIGKVYIYSGAGRKLLRNHEGENASDRFGLAISTIGDINGDSVPDYIVGAPYYDGEAGIDSGKIYLYSGLDGTLIHSIEGDQADANYGNSLAGSIDFNNDNLPDFAVGAPKFDSSNGKSSGKVFLYSSSDYSLIYEIIGENTDDRMGKCIVMSKDSSSSGTPSLLVTAPFFDGSPGNDSGKVYLYSTSNSSYRTHEGTTSGEEFGSCVFVTDDRDNDSIEDYFVSSLKFDGNNQTNSGKAFGYSGKTGEQIFFVEGYTANEGFSTSITDLGDYDGDGKNDVAISAPFFDYSGKEDVGKIYIYSGSNGNILKTEIGENAGDLLGIAMAAAGDQDGDEATDLVVGSSGYDGFAGTDSGKVVVVSKVTNNQLFSQYGETNGDFFGTHIGSLDWNKDGILDIVVGAGKFSSEKGKIYIYSTTDGSVLFSQEGENNSDGFGERVATGDFDGDGTDDLAVSATKGGASNEGKVYIYQGGTGNLLSSFTGENTNDSFGSDISLGSDYNKDSKLDLVVGAPNYDGPGTDRGKVYVYSGEDDSLLTTQVGENDGDQFGVSALGTGDFTGNGYGDIVIASRSFDGTAGANTGKFYVYEGNTDSLILEGEGDQAQASAERFYAGSISDIDKDGKNEIYISQPNYINSDGDKVGRAVIIAGGSTTASQSQMMIEEGKNVDEEFGRSVVNIGDFDGDGNPELVFSAPGYDSFTGRIVIVNAKTGNDYYSLVGNSETKGFGFSVVEMGDQNNDGLQDLGISAPSANSNSINTVGGVFIYGTP